MSCNVGNSSGNSRGWSLLLWKIERSSRSALRGRKKRELRSCLWLREHDPSTLDGLLESALLGRDNKIKLAAAGTLLAATDALAEAFSAIGADTPGRNPARQTPAPSSARADDKKVLENLAVSLAELFVPLLAAIALGRKSRRPPSGSFVAQATEGLPSPASSPAGGGGGGGGGGAEGGRAHEVVGTSSARPVAAPGAQGASSQTLVATAAAAAAAAARPTTLSCFAAECALALISLAALVASSPPVITSAAGRDGDSDGGEGGGRGVGVAFARLAEVESTPSTGETAEEVSGTSGENSREKGAEAQPRSGPSVTVSKNADDEGQKGSAMAGGCERKGEVGKMEAEECTRRRALAVLSGLYPATTIPLVILAEAWLGGGAEGAVAAAGAAAAATAAAAGRGHTVARLGGGNPISISGDLARSGEHAGPGGGIPASLSGSHTGSGMVATGPQHNGEGVVGKGLAVRAVRDLTAVVVSGMGMSRRLREIQAERRRVLERDGLEAWSPIECEAAANELAEQHAAWHLARTIPAILRNRRWPTATLKVGPAAASVAARGGAGVRQSAGATSGREELEELVGQLRACDPRTYEMAGVEPPQGLEERRWLALRKLCLCLAGVKARDLFGISCHYGEGPDGHDSGTAAGGSSGLDDSGVGGGGGLIGALQETLVRSLCGSKPEVQKLSASALVWVISRALEERSDPACSAGPTSSMKRAAVVHVRALVGLLCQEGVGATSDSARLVLTGLAAEWPMVVIPEVLRAAGEVASPAETRGAFSVRSTTSTTSATSTTRLNLTVILSDTLTSGTRFSNHQSFLSSLSAGACAPLLREEDVVVYEKGGSPFDAVGDVGDHLIRCLGSDDLRLRNVASRGLVSLDPGWVIPRLYKRLLLLQSGHGRREEEGDLEQRRQRRWWRLGGEQVEKGPLAGVGGAGWESRGRSACLQALGDVVVLGRDPPAALATLLDSLRNDAALDENQPARVGGGGDDDGGGDGSGGDDGGGGGSGGSGGKKAKARGVVDHVMSSLPLWARRLEKRSDEAPSPHPAAASCAPAAEAEDDEKEEESEEKEYSPAAIVSPTMFGDCLEVAAIKALAAPAEPLPVRFFAVLAAAIATSATTTATAATAATAIAIVSDVAGASAATPQADPPKTLLCTQVAPAMQPHGAERAALDKSARPAQEEVARFRSEARTAAVGAAESESEPGVEARAATAEAAAGGEATVAATVGRLVGGKETTPRRSRGIRRSEVIQHRRSTLAGVLDIVRGRMRGQERLSEELLGDESQQASENVRTLLFSRLTPLLILNALPPGALVAEDEQQQQQQQRGKTKADLRRYGGAASQERTEVFCPRGGSSASSKDGGEGGGGEGGVRESGEVVQGCMEEIRELLLERTERLYEYDQVQKMSAEISGILPPRIILPGIVARLNRFSESVEIAIQDREKSEEVPSENPGDDVLASPGTLASRALFTTCYAVTNHGSLVGPWIGMLLSAIVRVALLPAKPNAGDDVRKAQHAAINCLAVLLQSSAQAPFATAANPKALPIVAQAATPYSTATNSSTESSSGKSSSNAEASSRVLRTNTSTTTAGTSTAPATATAKTGVSLNSKAAAASEVMTASDVVPPWEVASTSVIVPSSELFTSSEIVAPSGTMQMKVEDVPRFVASVAVEGIFPEGFRGGEGPGWLKGAPQEGRRREGEVKHGGGSGALLPMQLRMFFANSAVTAARRCPQELLPALCSHGNFLGKFLRGGSTGGGLLRAACLQAVFALVYRTKDLFGGEGDASVRCTCDDVMQVACDALGKEQHLEVRLCGLKLLLGVAAAGASPGATTSAGGAPPSPLRHSDERPFPPSISEVKTASRGVGFRPRSGGGHGGGDSQDGGSTGCSTVESGRIAAAAAGEGAGHHRFTLPGRPRGENNHAGGGGAMAPGIVSPAMVSRARRLLQGMSNIDESADVRRLAGQALAALEGGPASYRG